MLHQYLAFELAYRGHLHEAYAADRTLLLDRNASRFTNFRDPFLSLSLLGAIPESVAATTFGGLPEETRYRWRGSRAAPSRKPAVRQAAAARSGADTSTLPLARISRWQERTPRRRCV